jgi:hypothetical protein
MKEKTAILLGGRNDGYKEDERIIVCLTSMVNTFDEVYFCDWNSPEQNGPLLWKIKDKLPHTGKIKHFIIPENIANYITQNYPDASPFNWNISQNLMIRRCKANWIVCSTLDIIAPKKKHFDNFIKQANKNTFYTVSRRDVDYLELEKLGFDKWELFRNKMDKISKPRHLPAKVTPNDHYSLINCCGDFQVAHRDVWINIKGFEENMIYSCFNDTNVQKKAVINGYKLQDYYDLKLYHLSHKGMNNDGSSPSKQYYNNPWVWIENFNQTCNNESWGMNDIEIEFEII